MLYLIVEIISNKQGMCDLHDGHKKDWQELAATLSHSVRSKRNKNITYKKRIQHNICSRSMHACMCVLQSSVSGIKQYHYALLVADTQKGLLPYTSSELHI
jgi:hypothetical protein